MNYLEGWFFLDLVAILPFDKFFASASGAENFNAIARFARIGRLYKIIRMTRLAKLFKILKSKNTIMTQFSTKLKIDHGQERLVFLAFFLLFFFHIAGCFFIIIAQMIDTSHDDETDYVSNSWVTKYCKDENGVVKYDSTMYIKSLYFIITTVATVGYGDISPQNNAEMIYCIMLMLFGVLLFTFVSGALSSILSNYDSQQA